MMTFQLGLPRARYQDITKQWAFYHSMIDALNALPGVRGTAVSSGLPMGGGLYTHTPFMPVGSTVLPASTALPADWRGVNAGFFRTMEISLLSGRPFGDQDGPGGAGTAIVSASFAKKVWGGDPPLGRIIMTGAKKPLTVVGVVGDVRGTALNTPPEPTVYFPLSAQQWPSIDVAVRTAGDPNMVVSAIRQALRNLDAALPMASVRTMDEWISSNAAQPRLNTTLLGVFAGIALLIAAIGIYGVLSYSVTQRTREIGLRMALGAQPSNVLRLVVREGMLVAAVGVGAGIAGALAVSRLLSTMLFGVAPRDPKTLAAVAVALAAIALAACCIPARRAARVDPIVALRDE